MSWTKEERREYNRKWREENKEKLISYRQRSKEKNKIYFENWKKRRFGNHKKYVEYTRENRAAYIKAHREERNALARKKAKEDPHFLIRRKATNTVAVAIRTGRLRRMPCEVCGDKNTQAHHCNYNNLLDVHWLCRKHHIEWHKNNDPIYPEENVYT